MEGFARKVGKWVVEIAEDFGANVIKLENLKNLIKNVDKLPKEFRDKLYNCNTVVCSLDRLAG